MKNFNVQCSVFLAAAAVPLGVFAYTTNLAAVDVATNVTALPVMPPVALPATPSDMLSYAATAGVAVLVPMLVGVIKAWFPWVQKSYPHTLPVIAIAFGPVLVWLLNQLTTCNVAGFQGIILGAAGVGLREVYDQTKSVWPAAPVDS